MIKKMFFGEGLKKTIGFELIAEFNTGISGNIRGMYITNDFTKIFLAEYSGQERFFRYDMSLANDLSTASINSSINSGINGSFGFTAKPDGSKIFSTNIIGQYRALSFNLSPQWNLTSIMGEVQSNIDVPVYPRNIAFSPDGMLFWVSGNPFAIQEFTCVNPYDINEMTKTATYPMNNEWLTIFDDGKHFFSGLLGQINLYKFNTPYSFYGGYSQITIPNVSDMLFDYGIVTNDGEFIYIIRRSSGNKVIEQYRIIFNNMNRPY
jgi:hypothetical protein